MFFLNWNSLVGPFYHLQAWQASATGILYRGALTDRMGVSSVVRSPPCYVGVHRLGSCSKCPSTRGPCMNAPWAGWCRLWWDDGVITRAAPQPRARRVARVATSCSNSVVVWKEAMASLLPDLEVKDEIKLDSKRLLTVNPHDNKEEERPCCVRVCWLQWPGLGRVYNYCSAQQTQTCPERG